MSSRSRPTKPPTDLDSSPVAVPSPSASVVLIAPLQARTADGYDYRVLLLKRHGRSSTFVSAHVFPGGNVDPIDSSNVWDELYPASGSPPVDAEAARMRCLQICAARECFEECGILLEESAGGKGKEAWAGVPAAQRMEWRDKVHDNGTSFVDLFKFISSKSGVPSRPALSVLSYRANWITPRINSRRFDTHFFCTILEPSVAPSVLPSSTSTNPAISEHFASSDGKETVLAEWVTPLEGLKRTLSHTRELQAEANPPTTATGAHTAPSSSNILLFPPQFYLLSELAAHKSYSTILAGKPRDVKAFEPELKRIKTGRGDVWPATVLPGDPEHTATEALLKSLGLDAGENKRRHRTFVLLPAKVPGKKPPPGLTVIGCQRRGMEEVLGPGWPDMQEGDIGEGGNPKL